MGVEVTSGHRTWALRVAGRPDAADLRRALHEVAAAGGGPVQVWVTEPTADDDDVLASVGFVPSRDLFELRVPLPLDETTDLAWRPFEPGRDDEAWLAVNNRAFDWHPEQGGWTLPMLRERLAEPWFDPAGFLVHERDGRLAGFCWTKVHDDHDPPLGEIYVIAIDPDFAGAGLGRALTVAGLDWLHRARAVSTGMLYVDGSNTRAVALYDKLGFRRHHLDRAYAGEVAAA
jgi:mycothiol synthase